MPVLQLYARQSVNGCREVRQASLASLQRTLVANEVLSNAEVDHVLVFEQLVFPTLDELLKPQVFRRDPEGMGETRLQASALVSRIFLHYLTSFERRGARADMTDLWLKILGSLDRMMHSGRRDQMVRSPSAPL
jgi:brefeldin A-resistance guanine nucleotide exchange factor 1